MGGISQIPHDSSDAPPDSSDAPSDPPPGSSMAPHMALLRWLLLASLATMLAAFITLVTYTWCACTCCAISCARLLPRVLRRVKRRVLTRVMPRAVRVATGESPAELIQEQELGCAWRGREARNSEPAHFSDAEGDADAEGEAEADAEGHEQGGVADLAHDPRTNDQVHEVGHPHQLHQLGHTKLVKLADSKHAKKASIKYTKLDGAPT